MHHFTKSEEQVLGRLFVAKLREKRDNVSLFEAFQAVTTSILIEFLDTDLPDDDVDEFEQIVRDVPTPNIHSFEAGASMILEYLDHGGDFADITNWLGIPLDNAAAVLAMLVLDPEDQLTMLEWDEPEWTTVERVVKRHKDSSGEGILAFTMDISTETSATILSWYGATGEQS